MKARISNLPTVDPEDSRLLNDAEIIKEWIDYFEQIGAFAKECFPLFDENKIIEVRLEASLESYKEGIPKDKIKGALVIYVLKRNGKFALDYSFGEHDLIFTEWQLKMVNSKAATWEELHSWAGKLIKAYEDVLPKD